MGLIVAFALAVALAPAAAALARRFGVVDRPGPLKVQAQPVPYLGGLAVLAGVLGPTLVQMPWVAAALGLAALLGLADDVADLRPTLRLPAELAIGIVVALAVEVPGPLVPAAVVVTVVLVNAVNLLDGLDGLAAGVATVAAVGFAIVLDGDPRLLALALAGSLLGFLVWNRPPARIYLGDAGSYLIGTALAALVCSTLARGGSVPVSAAAVLLVGVPVGDTAVAVVRRWRAHRPLFAGDRGHVYDQLVARGWTTGRATVACVLAGALLGALAVGVAQLDNGPAVVIAAGSVAVVAAWALPTFTGPSQ